MNTYRVIWEIDVEADNPKAAAEEALAIQRDPDSTATCFVVIPNPKYVMSGGPTIITRKLLKEAVDVYLESGDIEPVR